MHKQNRLAKREDFNKVYRWGKSTANHQFVLYRRNKSTPDPLRVGVSVSKKVGNAVVRNRIRRVVKEIIRLNLDRIEGNSDIIFIARKPVAEMNYDEIQKSLMHVMRKASLLKKK
ncbi:ribonuclease P protein component [Paenibacillus sp. J2TS4]|uniref:ribonuclease P protein component n=1 Tax=Paenibacillus sp. J2TS4 TaxID=2807194 RepID=UPI001AFE7BA3|nr:ribonuclease P protein component [Paenibacillus sp. J2TS4]GIP36027.1 ribonuclease P protein component [Paenibacillus sp. J2TS4]